MFVLNTKHDTRHADWVVLIEEKNHMHLHLPFTLAISAMICGKFNSVNCQQLTRVFWNRA